MKFSSMYENFVVYYTTRITLDCHPYRFYTLLVISTALFNKPPYKNLIVNGLVLAK